MSVSSVREVPVTTPTSLPTGEFTPERGPTSVASVGNAITRAQVSSYTRESHRRETLRARCLWEAV